MVEIAFSSFVLKSCSEDGVRWFASCAQLSKQPCSVAVDALGAREGWGAGTRNGSGKRESRAEWLGGGVDMARSIEAKSHEPPSGSGSEVADVGVQSVEGGIMEMESLVSVVREDWDCRGPIEGGGKSGC